MILSIEAPAYFLLIIVVCYQDTISIGDSLEGLNGYILNGTRTVLRVGRGRAAPNLPDVNRNE